MSARFDTKLPSESVPLTFDFSADLLSGETLITPSVVSIYTSMGKDASPTSIQNGSPQLNAGSTAVILPVKGGLDLCEYDIEVKCTTSNSLKVLSMLGTLPVREKSP